MRKWRVLCAAFALTAIWLVVDRFLARPNYETLIEEVPELSKDRVLQLLHEAESDMAHRRQLVERVCTKYNLGLYRSSAEQSVFPHPSTPRYKIFYVDMAHKLTYCPLYKVASSTWRHQLLRLAGYTEDFLRNDSLRISRLAREIYPEPDDETTEEAFRTTTKLLTVRHPFERLLSAYRDKLENATDRQYFYATYGKSIVTKFRKTHSMQQKEPTFREFVAHLTSEDPSCFDDHWTQYYRFCTPCLVRYDVIAHFETMLRDQLYLIHAADLQDVLRPRWRHLTKGKRSVGTTARLYFSQLSRSQVQQLYRVFQLDFELFGYLPDEYLALASPT